MDPSLSRFRAARRRARNEDAVRREKVQVFRS